MMEQANAVLNFSPSTKRLSSTVPTSVTRLALREICEDALVWSRDLSRASLGNLSMDFAQDMVWNGELSAQEL